MGLFNKGKKEQEMDEQTDSYEPIEDAAVTRESEAESGKISTQDETAQNPAPAHDTAAGSDGTVPQASVTKDDPVESGKGTIVEQADDSEPDPIQERADRTAKELEKPSADPNVTFGKKKTKELRRMSRLELIDVIYALALSNRDLKAENSHLASTLNERRVKIRRAGSIADASVSINKIFESAQAAADQYLDSVKASMDDPEAREALMRERERRAESAVKAGSDAEPEGAAMAASTDFMREAKQQSDLLLMQARTAADEEYRAALKAHQDADAHQKEIGDKLAEIDRKLADAETQSAEKLADAEAQSAAKTAEADALLADAELKAENRLAEAEAAADEKKAAAEEILRQANEKLTAAEAQSMQQLADAEAQAQQKLAEADEQAAQKIAEADEQAARKIAEANAEAERKVVEANEEARRKLAEVDHQSVQRVAAAEQEAAARTETYRSQLQQIMAMQAEAEDKLKSTHSMQEEAEKNAAKALRDKTEAEQKLAETSEHLVRAARALEDQQSEARQQARDEVADIRTEAEKELADARERHAYAKKEFEAVRRKQAQLDKRLEELGVTADEGQNISPEVLFNRKLKELAEMVRRHPELRDRLSRKM